MSDSMMPCEGNVLLPVTGDSHHPGWNAAWHGADSLSARCSTLKVSTGLTCVAWGQTLLVCVPCAADI